MQGKPVEKVGYKGSYSILIVLVVSDFGIHEMWPICGEAGSHIYCPGGG